MARPKTPEGKRVTICARFSEAQAAEIDAARGNVDRSTWLRAAALAATEPPPVPAEPVSPPRRTRKPLADTAPPVKLREPKTAATNKCEHRVRVGSFCKDCGKIKQ